MSKIDLIWREREIGKAQTPRTFLDVVVDGRSFYDLFGDRISPFGWLDSAGNQKATDRFLLLRSGDFPNDRRSIYVCAECADLGCGAISAVIEKIGEQIIWRDFGYENNYEDSVYFDDYTEIGPFSFDVQEYENTIRKAAADDRPKQ